MKNSDQPAFPISEEETDRIDTGVCIYTGVTKREYFAAMAMQGLLADPNTINLSHAAKSAVQCADDLLSALETKQNSETTNP